MRTSSIYIPPRDGNDDVSPAVSVLILDFEHIKFASEFSAQEKFMVSNNDFEV